MFIQSALVECLVMGRGCITFPQHPHPRRGDGPCGGENRTDHGHGRDLSRKAALNPKPPLAWEGRVWPVSYRGES